jgi:GT2 family glycosyltransferase
MNPLQADKDALTRSSHELDVARARLAEVVEVYHATERSKFARLRNVVRAIRSLVTRGPALPTSIAVGPMSLTHASIATARASQTAPLTPPARSPYDRWLDRHALRDDDVVRIRATSKLLPYRPVISILMATYNSPDAYLRQAIDSVRAQAYAEWELCIADDASTDARVRKTIDGYAASDARIRVVKRTTNGHISEASNSALAIATGEFVGFLDHDDLLTPDALFEVALLLNQRPATDFIYSDEDKIDDAGTLSEPHFKPDWAPDSFLSRMYTCHFSVMRKALVDEVGGMRSQFDGSQDYDLTLRVTERTTKIEHIPRILYHWRKHANSTAMMLSSKPYTSVAAERALTEAISRRNEPGTVTEREDAPGTYIVRYEINRPGKVSIIIPTRDHGADVERCLVSIFAKTTYENFDVILLDNGSTDQASIRTFNSWTKRQKRVKVLRHDVPFNFSAINNFAAHMTDGEYLLFLNNDTEVISNDWLEAMVEQAQRGAIGAVGGLLLFPDDTVQHAGVIIGIGSVAGHSHKYYPRDANGYFSMLKAINNYSAVTGACLMVRRQVFEEVGGLDESLAVAFNDVDFCLKVSQAGYRNIYLPHVLLYHHESKSRGEDTTPEKQARFKSEIDKMFERWNTADYRDPYYSPHLTITHQDFAIRT